MAGSLQRERDSAKSDAAKLERDNRALSYKVADLARKLTDATSHIERLYKHGGSLNHDGNPNAGDSSKDGGSPQEGDSPRQEVVSKGKGKVNSEAGTSQQQQAEAEGSTTVVTQADAQDASLTLPQVLLSTSAAILLLTLIPSEHRPIGSNSKAARISG